MHKIDFDAIIIGAGPGGSNAAARMLETGLKIAQFDRYAFPRVKPCAGVITVKAMNACVRNIEPRIISNHKDVQLNFWQKRINHFVLKKTILRTVSRPDFDYYLVEKNQEEKNFTFFDNSEVTRIEYDGFFKVYTIKYVFTSNHLVGADGADGITNRIFRISQPRDSAIGLEVDLNLSPDCPVSMPPTYDLGAVPRGYGWIFPKGNHCSAGLYTYTKEIRNARQLLEEYIDSKGLQTGKRILGRLRGHTIPVGGYNLNPCRIPVYIVGDAGAFADALTGEGIFHALESGRLAAETILQVESGTGSYEDYYRKLKKRVLFDTEVSYNVSRRFYAGLAKGMYLLENPVVWRTVLQGSVDGATYREMISFPLFYILKSLVSNIEHHRDNL